jgi:hypothetical protein
MFLTASKQLASLLRGLPKWHWSYVCELLRFVIHFRSQPAGDRDEPYNTILCLVCP